MSKFKLKTKKAASKRFVQKKRCYLRKHAYNSHLFLNKSSKTKRNLSGVTKISIVDLNILKNLLPYN